MRETKQEDQGAAGAASPMTPEERATALARMSCAHDSYYGVQCAACVVPAIRAAVAVRDTEWREALLLWSGGSPLNTSDEFGAKLRALIAADAAEPPNE